MLSPTPCLSYKTPITTSLHIYLCFSDEQLSVPLNKKHATGKHSFPPKSPRHPAHTEQRQAQRWGSQIATEWLSGQPSTTGAQCGRLAKPQESLNSCPECSGRIRSLCQKASASRQCTVLNFHAKGSPTPNAAEACRKGPCLPGNSAQQQSLPCLENVWSFKKLLLKKSHQHRSGGSVVKNPPANAGDVGLIPAPGRCPHAAEQLSLRASTTQSEFYWELWLAKPMDAHSLCRNKRSHRD